MAQHGPGGGHTESNRPWSVVVSIEFRTERDARRFEKYLKSGSGRAFAKRHFAGDVATPAGHPVLRSDTEDAGPNQSR